MVGITLVRKNGLGQLRLTIKSKIKFLLQEPYGQLLNPSLCVCSLTLITEALCLAAYAPQNAYDEMHG